MKSMKDYIEKEQAIYENILANTAEIFQKVTKITTSSRAPYDTVVIFATGSSANAALAAQPYMAKKLQKPIYVEEPSYAANYMLYLNKKTLYIAISQGGHSYSTIHLVKEIEKQGGTVFTITSDFASPIAECAQHVIGLGMEVEEMPYVTAGYSATILVLMCLALELSRQSQEITSDDYQAEITAMKKIASCLPKVITASEKWLALNGKGFLFAKRMIFIGYGGTYGVACEGETKVTETMRITAFGKELEEYMHGPYIGLHEDDHIFFLEPEGVLADRTERLKTFLHHHVKNIYTIYAKKAQTWLGKNDLSCEIDTDERLAPLFMTIPIHLLAYQISKRKQINLEVSAYPEFDQITKSKI